MTALKPNTRRRTQPLRGLSEFRPTPVGDDHRMFRPSFIGLVYIVVGVAVAASYDYFKNLETFRRIASAVLAVLLWPLLLLGIDLHIKK